MNEELTNPTLSKKRNRQKAVEPDVSSYDEFLDSLYDDLEFIMTQLSQSRDKYAIGMKINSKQSEDLINTTIANMLCCRGYEATHDTHINGHADIVVKLPYTDYLWIAESKINKGSQYIYKGFKQLLYRYSTGLDNRTSGGIFIYMANTKKTQTSIMADWKKLLSGEEVQAEAGFEPMDPDKDANVLEKSQYQTLPVLKFEKCPKNSLYFYSYHTHPQSGKEYILRHMSIDFRHEPQE